MKHARALPLLIVAVILAACQQLGVVKPDTFTESLAYGYSQNAAIRTSAAQSLKAGSIQKVDAQRVLSVTDTARQALDGAKAAQGVGDMNTALGRLQMATDLLQSAQVFLNARSVK